MTLPSGTWTKARAPRLIALTDRSLAPAAETLRRFERVARAARPHSVMFQLRDRQLPARERLAFGRELAALCRAEQQWFQVNDRLDLALLLAADAVHLPESGIAAEDARALLGAEAFVSRARHDPAAVAEWGVTAYVLSPVLAPRKGRPALGLNELAGLARRLDAPGEAPRAGGSGEPRARSTTGVYALGGISADNAASCLAAGAWGVVVAGAVLAAPEPEALVVGLGVAR